MSSKATQRIHIIGICGTFMGGIARLASEMGMQVSGSDANTYPPMSTQLEQLGVELAEGYRASNVPEHVDIVLVGNTISRGNPELEHVLNTGLAYTSGAQWLGEHVLQGRWVLAVAGTHGKTTTSSILAWLLEDNGLAPGYLIGGVPENFGQSARLGETPFFVIEADEYDTAFCDKRSKFVHYRPRTLVLNNLEFDHADIFADLDAIKTQFHHLLKTIPENGQIIHNRQAQALDQVLEMGCWSECKSFHGADAEWQVEKISSDAAQFTIIHDNQRHAVKWPQIGDHNMLNALAAVAAAHHVGVPIAHSVRSLSNFKSVKRRLEVIHDTPQVRVFDDFAHHPTAIAETVQALRNNVADELIIAVLEPRSNTMKRGVHKHLLAEALAQADQVKVFADQNVKWDINALQSDKITTFSDTQSLLEDIQANLEGHAGRANILIMSNGGFENLYQRLLQRLS